VFRNQSGCTIQDKVIVRKMDIMGHLVWILAFDDQQDHLD
jgi:hypothetical protein